MRTAATQVVLLKRKAEPIDIKVTLVSGKTFLFEDVVQLNVGAAGELSMCKGSGWFFTFAPGTWAAVCRSEQDASSSPRESNAA